MLEGLSRTSQRLGKYCTGMVIYSFQNLRFTVYHIPEMFNYCTARVILVGGKQWP